MNVEISFQKDFKFVIKFEICEKFCLDVSL